MSHPPAHKLLALFGPEYSFLSRSLNLTPRPSRESYSSRASSHHVTPLLALYLLKPYSQAETRAATPSETHPPPRSPPQNSPLTPLCLHCHLTYILHQLMVFSTKVMADNRSVPPAASRVRICVAVLDKASVNSL